MTQRQTFKCKTPGCPEWVEYRRDPIPAMEESHDVYLTCDLGHRHKYSIGDGD